MSAEPWVASCARHKWEFSHNVNRTRRFNNGSAQISRRGLYKCPHCGARKLGMCGIIKSTEENEKL